jgi:hypothetical protein
VFGKSLSLWSRREEKQSPHARGMGRNEPGAAAPSPPLEEPNRIERNHCFSGIFDEIGLIIEKNLSVNSQNIFPH